MRKVKPSFGVVLATFLIASLVWSISSAQSQQKPLDVPYFSTPQSVVEEMLSLATITKDDVIYDLGSGDGRIVITAAKKYGARGVGIDIDPARIKEARLNAARAGVEKRVKFIEQDLFDTDLKEATVVTLYLSPEVNLRLRPKLWSELKPGTRIVSHDFDMGDWTPQRTKRVRYEATGPDIPYKPAFGFRTIYYWVIPEKITPQD